MINPYYFEYHANLADNFAVRIEAVAPHDSCLRPYYRLRLGGYGIVIYLDDEKARAIMDVLGSRPPLPTEADPEDVVSPYAPTMGDTEVLRG